jgi:hypothetical protein
MVSPALQVVEQALHRNSRPMEDGSATHYVEASRYNRLLHGLNDTSTASPRLTWASPSSIAANSSSLG